jgi:hypothetical protein
MILVVPQQTTRSGRVVKPDRKFDPGNGTADSKWQDTQESDLEMGDSEDEDEEVLEFDEDNEVLEFHLGTAPKATTYLTQNSEDDESTESVYGLAGHPSFPNPFYGLRENVEKAMFKHIAIDASPAHVFLDSCQWIDDVVMQMRLMSTNKYKPIDRANRSLNPDAKFAFHARGFAYQLMGISLHLLMHGDKPLGFQFENLQTFFGFVKRAYENAEDKQRRDKLSKRNVFWLARGFTPPIPENSLIPKKSSQSEEDSCSDGDAGVPRVTFNPAPMYAHRPREDDSSSSDDDSDDSDKTQPMSPPLKPKECLVDMQIEDFRKNEEDDDKTIGSLDL